MSTIFNGKKSSFDQRRSLTKSGSLEDVYDKINRISEKYSFVTNKPVALRADEEVGHDQISISEGPAIEANIFCSFKKVKGKINDSHLEKVKYKNKPLESNTIRVLQEALEGYRHLTILKFEFCSLTSEHIKLIDKLLNYFDTIEEISLNGNPVPEQKYYILLRHKLKMLSLKLCGINTEGVRRIASELSNPYDNPLLHLNLASNALFDEGVHHIAKMLRLNRKLISLNLADNKIRNAGLLVLLEPLQKFKLNDDEVIIRRLFKMDYHKKITCSVLNFGNNTRASYTRQKVQRYHSSIGSKRDKYSKPSLTASKVRSLTSHRQRSCPELPSHPLLQDCTEEDEHIFCKGNNVLINFNLAYNRITNKVVPDIVAMLEYQNQFVDENGKVGIARLSLIGNDISADILQELKTMLSDKPHITSEKSLKK